MARYARVVLNGAQTEDELNPLTIDLVLGEDRRVIQKFPTSGWWGTFRTDDFEPFVFFPTGKMDFGTGWEGDDRWSETNLPTKRLEVGEYVTVTNAYGEHCFVIKQVLWLDELPVEV